MILLQAERLASTMTVVAAGSNLRSGYDASIGKLISSGFGQKLTLFMSVCAAVLFVVLIFALVAKARGSSSAWVTNTAGSGKNVTYVSLTILALVSFQLIFPLLASLGDLCINGLLPIINNLIG